MTSKERLELYIHKVPDAEICEYCKHFCPHYISWFGWFKRLDSGHCVFPRIKTKHSYDTCQYFDKKNESEN